MEELDLKKLEGRVDDSHSHLQGERTRLIEKTELARTRVEAMIGRLKAIENDG